jgi:hypothetical protein
MASGLSERTRRSAGVGGAVSGVSALAAVCAVFVAVLSMFVLCALPSMGAELDKFDVMIEWMRAQNATFPQLIIRNDGSNYRGMHSINRRRQRFSSHPFFIVIVPPRPRCRRLVLLSSCVLGECDRYGQHNSDRSIGSDNDD